VTDHMEAKLSKSDTFISLEGLQQHTPDQRKPLKKNSDST
jgi:hypothetical protein